MNPKNENASKINVPIVELSSPGNLSPCQAVKAMQFLLQRRIILMSLQSLKKNFNILLEPDDVTSERSDVTYYIGMDFNKVNNYKFHHPENYPILTVPRSHHLYSPQLNGVSFTFPSSPLLSQYDDVIQIGDVICTPESMAKSKKNCTEEFCECTHTIHVKLGQVKRKSTFSTLVTS